MIIGISHKDINIIKAYRPLFWYRKFENAKLKTAENPDNFFVLDFTPDNEQKAWIDDQGGSYVVAKSVEDGQAFWVDLSKQITKAMSGCGDYQTIGNMCFPKLTGAQVQDSRQRAHAKNHKARVQSMFAGSALV